MNPRRLLPGLLLGLTGLAWTIAAPPPFTEAQAPKRGGTLRVAYGNEISNFDYHVAPGYELVWAVQNTYLSASTAGWNSTRHSDPKVDEYYARYAREMDPAKRKAIAKEFQEFSA